MKLKQLKEQALTHVKNRQFNFAEKIAKNLIGKFPENPVGWKVLGEVLKETGRAAQALNVLKTVVSLSPQNAYAHYNLGNIYQKLEEYKDAEASYIKAITLKPDFIQSMNNLSLSLKELGKIDEAIHVLKNAISLKPDYPELNYNLSYYYNLKGKFNKGLELYEWRTKITKKLARPPRKKMIWDGSEPLTSKNFLVYEEQGIGDIIQFCRYLPMLKKRGAKVTFKVTKKLHAILRTLDHEIVFTNSFPDEKLIDYEAPLLSLPFLFETNLRNIPNKIPYLFANQNRVLSYANVLDKKKFNIGICWKGAKNKFNTGRAFPLAMFKDISSLPGVELFSLLKESNDSEIKDINFDLNIFGDNFDAGDNAFLDTADVMINCDLIITSDTSIAHLAGALGCTTMVVLKKIPDWRWMLNRDDSPWYPGMTLYRQQKRGDWKSVFKKIMQDVEPMVKAKRAELI